MADANPELGTDQRSCHGGIHVPIDKHQVRLAFEHDGLEAHHDLSGLHRMRAGANRQIQVGWWKTELLKENIRHIDVVMLPGVDEGLRDVAAVLECSENGSDLHEIGARSDNVKYFQGIRPVLRASLTG